MRLSMISPLINLKSYHLASLTGHGLVFQIRLIPTRFRVESKFKKCYYIVSRRIKALPIKIVVEL